MTIASKPCLQIFKSVITLPFDNFSVLANGSNDFRIKSQESILIDNTFAFNKILYTTIVTR